MSFSTHETQTVLVIGVDAAIARDVARLVVQQGANVIAADADAAALARFHCDVGPARAHVETTRVDFCKDGEARAWGNTLRTGGQAPKLLICCCGAPAEAAGLRARRRRSAQPGDVALTHQRGRNCRAVLAERVLLTAITMHAEPLRRSVFDRALSVIRGPTLRGVLQSPPAGGVTAAAATQTTAEAGTSPAPLRLTPTDTTFHGAKAA